MVPRISASVTYRLCPRRWVYLWLQWKGQCWTERQTVVVGQTTERWSLRDLLWTSGRLRRGLSVVDIGSAPCIATTSWDRRHPVCCVCSIYWWCGTSQSPSRTAIPLLLPPLLLLVSIRFLPFFLVLVWSYGIAVVTRSTTLYARLIQLIADVIFLRQWFGLGSDCS